MKKLRYLLLAVAVIAIAVLASEPASAQCAMCKATVENQSSSDSNLAEGLNKGILYLMTIPYLIFGVIGYFWYKSSRKNSQDQSRISSILLKKLRGAVK